MTLSLTFDEFKKITSEKKYNLIPLICSVLSDLDTPVSTFLKIDQGDYAFLLESVTGGEQIARYSFIGSRPEKIFKAKGSQISLFEKGKEVKQYQHNDPISELKQWFGEYKPYPLPESLPFFGGAVGYFSYDAIRYVENIPDKNRDDLDTPDMLFLFSASIIAFDHVLNRLLIVQNIILPNETLTESGLQGLYDQAVSAIRETAFHLTKPLTISSSLKEKINSTPFETNMDKKYYQEMIEKAKDYIKDGDVFQVVLSRRFEKNLEGLSPFSIYRALRTINPSPYMYFLRLNDHYVVGASPEMMVRKENDTVILRPIAGTRRRGRNPEDELKMERELLADEKEIAEHIMLVDLGRNDLGRIASYGSVKVTEFKVVEKYSHVMHIVSNVTAQIKKDTSPFDIIKATFPAGTLSGAPKIRAMEIIDELETVKRGIYGGTITYFSFNGNMDCCIAIRTGLVKDDKIYIQAGGGIVYDSEWEKEFLETENKASAMLKAVDLAKEI